MPNVYGIEGIVARAKQVNPKNPSEYFIREDVIKALSQAGIDYAQINKALGMKPTLKEPELAPHKPAYIKWLLKSGGTPTNNNATAVEGVIQAVNDGRIPEQYIPYYVQLRGMPAYASSVIRQKVRNNKPQVQPVPTRDDSFGSFVKNIDTLSENVTEAYNLNKVPSIDIGSFNTRRSTKAVARTITNIPRSAKNAVIGFGEFGKQLYSLLPTSIANNLLTSIEEITTNPTYSASEKMKQLAKAVYGLSVTQRETLWTIAKGTVEMPLAFIKNPELIIEDPVGAVLSVLMVKGGYHGIKKGVNKIRGIAPEIPVRVIEAPGTRTQVKINEGNPIYDENGNPQTIVVETGETVYKVIVGEKKARGSRNTKDPYAINDENITSEIATDNRIRKGGKVVLETTDKAHAQSVMEKIIKDKSPVPLRNASTGGYLDKGVRNRISYEAERAAELNRIRQKSIQEQIQGEQSGVYPRNPAPAPQQTSGITENPAIPTTTPTHLINGQPVSLLEDGTFVKVGQNNSVGTPIQLKPTDTISTIGQSPETLTAPITPALTGRPSRKALPAPSASPDLQPAATAPEALVNLIETTRKGKKKKAVEPAPEVTPEIPAETSTSPVETPPPDVAASEPPTTFLELQDKFNEIFSKWKNEKDPLVKAGYTVEIDKIIKAQQDLSSSASIEPPVPKPSARKSRTTGKVDAKAKVEPVKPPVEEPPVVKTGIDAKIEAAEAKQAAAIERIKARRQQGTKNSIKDILKDEQGSADVDKAFEFAETVADYAEIIALHTYSSALKGIKITKATSLKILKETMEAIGELFDKNIFEQAYAKSNYYDPDTNTFKSDPILVEKLKVNVRTSRGAAQTTIAAKDAIFVKDDVIVAKDGATFKVIGEDSKRPGYLIVEPQKGFHVEGAKLYDAKGKEIKAKSGEFTTTRQSISINKIRTGEYRVRKATPQLTAGKSQLLEDTLSGKVASEGEGKLTKAQLDDISKDIYKTLDEQDANWEQNTQALVDELASNVPEEVATKGNKIANQFTEELKDILPTPGESSILKGNKEILTGQKKNFKTKESAWTKENYQKATTYLKSLTVKMADIADRYAKIMNAASQEGKSRASRGTRITAQYMNGVYEQLITEMMNKYDKIYDNLPDAFKNDLGVRKVYDANKVVGEVGEIIDISTIKERIIKLRGSLTFPSWEKFSEALHEQTNAANTSMPRGALTKEQIMEIGRQSNIEIGPTLLEGLYKKYGKPELNTDKFSNRQLLERDIKLRIEDKSIHVETNMLEHGNLLQLLEKQINKGNALKEPVSDVTLFRTAERNSKGLKAWELDDIVQQAKTNIASEVLTKGIRNYLKANPKATILDIYASMDKQLKASGLNKQAVKAAYETALSDVKAGDVPFGTRAYTKKVVKDFLDGGVKESITETTVLLAKILANEMTIIFKASGKLFDKNYTHPRLGELIRRLEEPIKAIGFGERPPNIVLKNAYDMAKEFHAGRVGRKDWAGLDPLRVTGGMPLTKYTNQTLGAMGRTPEGELIAIRGRKVQSNIISGVKAYVNDVVDKKTGNVTRLGSTSISNLIKKASRDSQDANIKVTNKRFIDTVELNRNDPLRIQASTGNSPFARAIRAHDILMEDARKSYVDYMKEQGYDIPDDWGITETGYFPHQFEGNFKIVETTPTGKVTHAAGLDFSEAMAYAKGLWEKNKIGTFDVQKMTARTGDAVLRVSTGQHSRIRARIMQNTPKGVVDWDIAGKALWGTLGKQTGRTKFFSHGMKRQGVSGFSTNYSKVMESYAGRLVRTQELTKFLKDTTPLIEEMATDKWAADLGIEKRNVPRLIEAAKDYQNAMLAHPDKFVKNLAQGFRNHGFHNVTETGIIKWYGRSKALISHFQLQAIPAYLAQGLQPFDWLGSAMGLERTQRAFRHAWSPKNKAWYDEHGFTPEPTKAVEMLKADKFTEALPFSRIGRRNQMVGYRAGYEYFVDTFKNEPMFKTAEGKAKFEEFARDYGREIQRLTEGNTTPADLPAILRTNTGGLLGMYQSFKINSMTRIKNVLASNPNIIGKANKAKAIAQMGGVKFAAGGIKGGGLVTKLFTTYFVLKTIEEQLKKRGFSANMANRLSHGIMYGALGLAKIDVSSSITPFDLPQGSTAEVIGSTAMGPNFNFYKDVVTSIGDVISRGSRLPGAFKPIIQQSRVLKGMEKARTGMVYDRGRNPVVRLDKWGRVSAGLGFRTQAESDNALLKNTPRKGLSPWSK